MGAFGAKVAAATVQSDWWQKVNWAQVVGFVCSAIAVVSGNALEVDADTQLKIVLTVQGIAAMLTIWFRRQDTTITPTAAAKLERGDA